MNHAELNITHILEFSPRGFANEVFVLPLSRPYAVRGEEVKSFAAGDTNAYAYLYPWSEAPAELRSRAGMMLRDMGTLKQYEECMDSNLLGAFAYDPDAYDWQDGQWGTHR